MIYIIHDKNQIWKILSEKWKCNFLTAKNLPFDLDVSLKEFIVWFERFTKRIYRLIWTFDWKNLSFDLNVWLKEFIIWFERLTERIQHLIWTFDWKNLSFFVSALWGTNLECIPSTEDGFQSNMSSREYLGYQGFSDLCSRQDIDKH